MINTPNNNPTRETLQENHWSRVKLWSETFQDNYKPDYDYSQFFNEIEKYFKNYHEPIRTIPENK